jgi:F-type H+-transporting ATPase subunit a
MIPGSFTVTSHIIVTFALAAFIFIGVTLIAIFKHGPIKFLHFFLPEGTPLLMAPLLFIIEFFSYLSRPISLSVRLAANMMAGHVTMKVIAGLIITFGMLVGVASMFPLLLFLTGFEIAIAVIQAYIFTVLTCVYLNDALHLH